MILWSDFSLSPLDHGMAFWSSHKTAKERKFCFVYMLGRHWKFPLRLASGKHTKRVVRVRNYLKKVARVNDMILYKKPQNREGSQEKVLLNTDIVRKHK